MKYFILTLFVMGYIFVYAQNQFLVINPDGHKSTIKDLVIDNNNYLITCGFDKTIKVWDSKRGIQIKEFRGQIGPGSEGMIYAMDLSPDQKYLAVGGWFGKDDESEKLGDVRIYNYKTGKLVKLLTRIHENVIFDLKFTKDSKYLIIGDGEGIITKWEVATKIPMVYEMVSLESIKTISVGEDYFISTHGDGMVYKWDLDKEKHKKKLDYFSKTKKSYYDEPIGTTSSNSEWIAIAGKYSAEVLILNQKMAIKNSFKVLNCEKIIDLSFSPSNNRIVLSYITFKGQNKASVFELMGSSWEKIVSIEKDALINDVRFLDEQTCIITGGHANAIEVWSIIDDKTKLLQSMHGVGQVYYSAALNGTHLMYGLTADKAYGLATYSDGFNLFTRRIEKLNAQVKYNFPLQNYNGWSLTEVDVVRESDWDPSYILNVEKNGTLKASIKRHPWDGNRHRSFSFVNANYIVSGGDYGILRAYDYSGKEVSQFIGHEGAVSSVSVSIDSSYLVTASYDNTIRLWTMNQIGKSETTAKISSMWSVIEDQGINSWKTKIREVGEEELAKESTTEAWQKVLKKLKDKGYNPEFLETYLNSALANKIYPIVSIFVASNSEWVIWNNNGYFSGSKKGAKFIGYHINQGKSKAAKFYPFEQFDLKFNRPDIIFKDLGIADDAIIELYHKAYIKRLKRSGLSEEDLMTEIHTPEIALSIINKTNKQAELKIKAADSKYELFKLNLFINDVPIYGMSGINLSELNTKELEKTYTIDLMSGENKIQVSVMNNKGAESLRETLYLNSNNEQEQNLYVIALGTSKYKDSRFDLKYAAKDAEDVVSMFDDNKIYTTVHNLLLTNERVTKSNIYKIKDFLSQVQTNDVVVLFVAGHGILNKDFDYYYCTHDVDFNHPEEKGISYNELETLFDGIKAIRKLLIMDTCHSGEVDKDEIEEIESNNTENGDIIFRSTSTTVIKERKGLKAINEIEKEMFNDLNRGTGTTVISSAGGVEFAMESDQWKNGLFTYCLLNGLQSKKADLNKDGVIYLSELQQYIRIEVGVKSNGKQVPTARFENISLDYPIW